VNASEGFRFRIKVERIDDETSTPLTFDVSHHDDIFAIAERVRKGTAFAESDALALAVGLKLFTGVMLTRRHDPLFADIQPAMRTFIGNLKSRIAATTIKSSLHDQKNCAVTQSGSLNLLSLSNGEPDSG
jgi:hypothetical protein